MTDSLDADLQDKPVEPVISHGADETFDKATVSKIVARERAKAYEKGKQEASLMSEQVQQPQAQPMQQQQQQPAAPAQTFGGIQQPQMRPEDIQQMIAQHVPQYMQAQAAEFQHNEFVKSFVGKIQAAETKYPGLEKKLTDLDFTKPGTRALAQMANGLDNTGDIMNELIENPDKMGILLNLIHEQPRLAQQRMASIGSSIKSNQDALAQEQSAQQPIGQLKSSINAGVDDKNLSVKDLKQLLLKKRR